MLIWVTVATPYRNGPSIRSDGVGYHAWTRALLTGDFSFCSWGNAEGMLSVIDRERGFCQNKYPVGLALLRLPFMAWHVDTVSEKPTISRAEHQSSRWLGAAVAMSCAALGMWASAMLGVPAWRSSALALCTMFGTGLFHYATYDGSFTHAYSALLCALLVAFAVRARTQRRPMPAPLIVLCSFFVPSLRITNLLLLMILCLAYLVALRPTFRAWLRDGACVALGVGLALGFQLYYNYIATGSLHASSYGEESFLFDRPMQREVLVSYERGLLTYYPVFGLALVAGFAVARARRWALLLTALVASYVMLYGYWHSWMLGGGMGHRGFVDLAPVVLIVLSVAVARLPRRVWLSVLGAAVICALVTTQVMIGYWGGHFPGGGATKEQFWRQERLAESWLTGGTTCRPSRCNLLRGTCTKRNAPDFMSCMVGSTYGVCSVGTCNPIVYLRSTDPLSGGRFVSAPPAPERKPKGKRLPLTAAAAVPGAWEELLVIPAHNDSAQVYLRAVSSRAYVTAGAEGEPLFTRAKEPGEQETFETIGSDQAISFRASNGKFITIPRDDHYHPLPLAAAAKERGPAETFAIERKPHEP